MGGVRLESLYGSKNRFRLAATCSMIRSKSEANELRFVRVISPIHCGGDNTAEAHLPVIHWSP